ncbi:hypothetical protein ACFQ60_23915 [Streptomyces zhihengii]
MSAERSPVRRLLLAERARAWDVALPASLYEDLLTGPARADAAELNGIPAPLLPGLATDADPRVRRAVCGRWDDLPAPLREPLLTDADDTVRTAALLAHHRSAPMPREVLAALPDRWRALEECRFAPALEAELVRDGDEEVRRTLAGNPRLGARAVAVLAQDPSGAVRSAVALRADLGEEQRAAVRHDFDPTTLCHPCPGSRACTATPGRCAAWPPRPIRSSAAAWPAPGGCRRTWWRHSRGTRTGWSGCSSPRRATTRRPRCCWRSGAGGTAASATPTARAAIPASPHRPAAPRRRPRGRMRRLVLDDPESTPADVARLARDPEAEVRCRAAEDPGCHRPTRCGC